MSVADQTQAEAGKWIHFDQSDGLPGDDVNNGSFFNDKDGSLWWGADTNIIHYIPPADLVTPKLAPPSFHIRFLLGRYTAPPCRSSQHPAAWVQDNRTYRLAPVRPPQRAAPALSHLARPIHVARDT